MLRDDINNAVKDAMLGCFRDNALTRQEFLGMAT